MRPARYGGFPGTNQLRSAPAEERMGGKVAERALKLGTGCRPMRRPIALWTKIPSHPLPCVCLAATPYACQSGVAGFR
jgi:hypothetical protein